MPEEAFAQEDPIVRMRLRGPELATVLGTEPPPAGARLLDLTFGGARVVLCGTGSDRAAVYCARSGARQCWDALVAAGAVPVGSTALETVRIEDGEPCLERDFTQPQQPACAGLGEFAPTDDARVLVAIEHEGPGARSPGACCGWRRGRWASCASGARSVQRAGRAIALATVDRALAAPGTAIDVDAGERVLAGVVVVQGRATRGQRGPELLSLISGGRLERA